MYDPRQSFQAQQAAYSRAAGTASTRSQSSRSSARAGKQAADTMRSAGVRGIGARPVTFPDRDDDRGSTYDYVPQTITTGLGGVRPTAPVEPEEKSVFTRAFDFFKSFGAEEPKEVEVSSNSVYKGPMFTNTPIDIAAMDARIRDAVDYSKAPPLVYKGGIPNDANMRYDVVPPPSANPNLQRNAINRIIKSLAPNSKEYKVKRGDTLSEIAQREGMKVADLVKINKIKDKNRIYEGETLLIPASQEVIKVMDIVDSVDPDAQFYQSGVPMDQRIFEPEDMTGFAGMGPDPSTGQGIMSPTPTTLTAEQRTALSDMGSDVMRTNLQKITNSRGNYSQTALTNAINKGIRNTTKKALLKGSVETEIGDRGLITEGTGYRLNRAYQMFEDATVDAALESLPLSEQTRIRNGAASNALGLAIMDIAYDGGSEYRGRGLVQLTHRRNYQAVEDILESNGINIDLVNNPDLANDTRYALPIAMAYLEHAGLTDTAAENSSTKDLNNRINAGADSTIANERWENVVQALRDAGQDEEADRMENRNEYAAQETVDTEVDGVIGPNSRAAMREWLRERNIIIPQNATDMDLVVLVNENS